MDSDELRERTIGVIDDRPLVGFLYDLMKIHLPVGTVEALVCDSEDITESELCSFTNGHLARYAQLLTERLAPGLRPDFMVTLQLVLLAVQETIDINDASPELFEAMTAFKKLTGWEAPSDEGT